MEILDFGTLAGSSGGDDVRGFMNIGNDGPETTIDILWGYGSYDVGTGNTSFVGYALSPNVTIPSQFTYWWKTEIFQTPYVSAVYDIVGFIASNITVNGGINISGMIDAKALINGWVIS